jgi:hypothetical protein
MKFRDSACKNTLDQVSTLQDYELNWTSRLPWSVNYKNSHMVLVPPTWLWHARCDGHIFVLTHLSHMPN